MPDRNVRVFWYSLFLTVNAIFMNSFVRAVIAIIFFSIVFSLLGLGHVVRAIIGNVTAPFLVLLLLGALYNRKR